MGQIREYLKISIKNLKTRPIRAWLTMIGVVIGVFLVVSLMSLSEGVKTSILQQLRMMGKDVIMIMPGEITNLVTMMAGGLELSDKDIEAIKGSEGVDIVVPMTYRGEAIRHEGESETLLIAGVPWEETLEILRAEMGWDINEGRWPIPGRREIAVGSFVPKDIFPAMRIGDQVFIRGRRFDVVGVLKSLGNRQDDFQIYLDIDIYREITGERTGAKVVIAKTKPGYETEYVVENIKTNLEYTRKRIRGEDSPSFTVLSSEKMGDIIGNVMIIIQIAIFGFASIAILVGGVGIMNTMYTSVHERIKDIGIMKAIGATSKTITTIFLIESGFFGFFGGLGGIVLGLGLAKTVEIVVNTTGELYLRASITPQLIILSLAFSFLIGCIAGYLPARSASKLNPVDALRYE